MDLFAAAIASLWDIFTYGNRENLKGDSGKLRLALSMPKGTNLDPFGAN